MVLLNVRGGRPGKNATREAFRDDSRGCYVSEEFSHCRSKLLATHHPASPPPSDGIE
jgi:hypothetical protein